MSQKNIWIAVSDGNQEVVEELIVSGQFTANSKDPNGYTPMHAAASYGLSDILKFLVDNGGDVNIQDNDGDTPLHHVEDVKMAKELVEKYNADWTKKNDSGQTPLQYLEEDEEFPEVIDYLKTLTGEEVVNDEAALKKQIAEIGRENIRYTFEEDEGSGNMEIDETRRKQLEDIVNSDNAQEKLRDFIAESVHQQFGFDDDEKSNDLKRRKET